MNRPITCGILIESIEKFCGLIPLLQNWIFLVACLVCVLFASANVWAHTCGGPNQMTLHVGEKGSYKIVPFPAGDTDRITASVTTPLGQYSAIVAVSPQSFNTPVSTAEFVITGVAPGTVTLEFKWIGPSASGLCRTQVTAMPTVATTEEFKDNCVKIIDDSQEIETNGVVSRPIGSTLGWKVVKNNISGRFLGTIQEAIDFEGTDQAGNKLDFSYLDTVKLGPCTFRENVVIPARHKTTGGILHGISIVGSGAATRIISSSGTTIRIDSGLQTKVLDLTINGSGKSTYLVDVSPTSTPIGTLYAEHVQAEDAVNGFHLPRGGGVHSCNFTNFTGNAINASGNLTVTSSELGVNRFENITDTAIAVTDGGLLAAKLLFAKVGVNAIYVTGDSSADLIKITGELKTVRNVVSLSGVKRKVEMSKVTGRRIEVRNSSDVSISDGLIVDSQTTGIFIDGSSVKLIFSDILVNRVGIEIRNGSKVQSSKNLIERNTEAGVVKDRSSVFKSDGDVIYNNGRGAKDNVVSGKFGGQVIPSAVSAPDSFQNDVIMGNVGPGIELSEDGNVDLGGGAAGSKGGNIIIGNGQYDLVNNTGVRISAKNNIWSSSDPNEILSKYVSPGAGADVAPVMPIQAKYFAQFAEAPGFTSTVTLTNPSRSNGAAAVLAFRNSVGTGANVPLNGNDSLGGLQPGAVAALGARSFSTNSATSAVNVGSMTVASGRPLAGTVLFSGPAGVAGVGASELLTQFIAPVEKSASLDFHGKEFA